MSVAPLSLWSIRPQPQSLRPANQSARTLRKRMQQGSRPQAAGKPQASGRSASHFRPLASWGGAARGCAVRRVARCSPCVKRVVTGASGSESPTTTIGAALCPQPSVPGPPPASNFIFQTQFPPTLGVPFPFAGSGALEEDKKGSGCEAKWRKVPRPQTGTAMKR